MTIAASVGQQLAMPQRNTADTTVASALLISGASFSTPVVCTSDEQVVVVNPSGTLTGDCTMIILVSPNGTNYGIFRTCSNAEIVNTNGFAVSVKAGVGNTIRFQFLAGTTSGAGNGVTARFKN